MPPTLTTNEDGDTVALWTLPYAATLGSSIRLKGILQEVRARLPLAARRGVAVRPGELTLSVPADIDGDPWIAKVEATLEGIETLPVIPREIEDILQISTTERHRWLKDGRLPSAGTRTVKLRGRAKKITFHIFDPAFVEDALNRDLVVDWREQDAETAAENRRRASWKARQKRELAKAAATAERGDGTAPNLVGWEEFAKTGLP